MKRITGKSTKKKNINIKFFILSFILFLVVFFLAIRNFPTVRNIDIIMSNNAIPKFTKEEVVALANIKIGDKLYKETRSKISGRIEQNPYIKSVKIDRDFSGKVKIEISQREPKYLINYAGEYIYIDDEGYVLEVSSESIDIPVIIGLTTDFSQVSIGNSKIRLNQEDLEKIEIVNNIISTLKSNNVDNRINSIDVTDKKNFILYLEDDEKKVYIGDGSDLNTRVLYMKKILEKESGHTGDIYINGNLDEGYVYFKEQ